MPNEQTTLNISWATILKIILVIICVYFLYLVKDLLIWLVFALIIGILFNFIIDALEKKKIPRVVASIVLYFGVFFLLGFFIYKTTPILIAEIETFSGNFSHYLQEISPILNKLGFGKIDNINNLGNILFQGNLQKAGRNIFNALFAIFGGVFSTLFVVFLAFFISLEKDFGEKVFRAFLPVRYKDSFLGFWRTAKKKVSGWFISRVIGAVFVSSLTYLVLWVLDIKYAFTFSLAAGILDFIPFMGPLVVGLSIALIVALNSIAQAGFVLVAFFSIQELENHLLFPLLFKKFIGLPPVLVFLAFAVGAKLWGILGAVLAIPLAGVLFEVVKDYLEKKKEIEVEEPLLPEE